MTLYFFICWIWSFYRCFLFRKKVNLPACSYHIICFYFSLQTSVKVEGGKWRSQVFMLFLTTWWIMKMIYCSWIFLVINHIGAIIQYDYNKLCLCWVLVCFCVCAWPSSPDVNWFSTVTSHYTNMRHEGVQFHLCRGDDSLWCNYISILLSYSVRVCVCVCVCVCVWGLYYYLYQDRSLFFNHRGLFGHLFWRLE